MPAISSSSWIISNMTTSEAPKPSMVLARLSNVPSVLLAQAKTLAKATTSRITADISADSTSTS